MLVLLKHYWLDNMLFRKDYILYLNPKALLLQLFMTKYMLNESESGLQLCFTTNNVVLYNPAIFCEQVLCIITDAAASLP